MNLKRLQQTAPAQNKSRLIAKDQTARQIAAMLLLAEKHSRPHTEKIKNFFASNSTIGTCQKLHFFMRDNLPYNREPAEKQTAKTINRILKDAYKGNDCKHYATLAVSVLKSLNIPCAFRLVSFNSSKTPTHAYAVALDENGNTIFIDGCLKHFNTESNYKHKFDLQPLN